jgi:hypothetical protein
MCYREHIMLSARAGCETIVRQLAHPLDDGTAVLLERDLGAAKISLGADGNAWASSCSRLLSAGVNSPPRCFARFARFRNIPGSWCVLG